jgi:hypothetical protein
MGIMDWLDPDADEREQTQARRSRGREAFGRAGGMPFTGASGFHQWAQGAMAPGMAAHANAANQINDAIESEMQSRVAQEREMRRQEHEKALMQMRLEAQKRDQDGALIRALLNG